MKSIFSAVVLVLLAGTTFNTVQAENYNIAYVSIQQLYNESPQAQALNEELKKEFAPRERQLLADQKKQKDMEDRLTKDAAIMSETERNKLERDIIALRRDSKRNADEFKEDVSFRRNESFTKLQKIISEAILAIAKQRKLDLVLTETGAPYASEKVDITLDIINFLKNSNQKPAAQPQ